MRNRPGAGKKITRLHNQDNGIVQIRVCLGRHFDGKNDITCTLQFNNGEVVQGRSQKDLLDAVNEAEAQWLARVEQLKP